MGEENGKRSPSEEPAELKRLRPLFTCNASMLPKIETPPIGGFFSVDVGFCSNIGVESTPLEVSLKDEREARMRVGAEWSKMGVLVACSSSFLTSLLDNELNGERMSRCWVRGCGAGGGGAEESIIVEKEDASL